MYSLTGLLRLGVGVMLVLLLASACASHSNSGYYGNRYNDSAAQGFAPGSRGYSTGRAVLPARIAVLGVVSAKDNLRDFQQKNLANELGLLLRAEHRDTELLPYSQVQAVLRSRDQHRLILQRYQVNGKLSEADLDVLRVADLPVRYVLIARIDKNETAQFQPMKTPVKNSQGDALTDRLKVSLLHQRAVEVAARVYDIANAREIWAGAFVSEPVNETSYTEYTGSSFTGSMATRLTNSFIHGRRGERYPPAPSSADALHEVFKGIAATLAGRSINGFL